MSTADLLIVGVAVVLGALVKSVTGMGLPLIALPIISLFVSPETGIAVLAIPAIVQNVGIVATNWHARSQTRGLLSFCLAGGVGVILGTLSLGAVPEQVTLIALNATIISWLYQRLRNPDHHVSHDKERTYSPIAGLIAGVFQGGSGVSGPVVAAWHQALRLPRDAFVFSIATAFGLIGIVQTITLAARGHLEGRLLVSLLISVIVLSSVPFGPPLRRRLSGAAFDRAVLVLVIASCISLTVDIIVSFVR
jgi:uncharacterized membrane protein YfcA